MPSRSGSELPKISFGASLTGHHHRGLREYLGSLVDRGLPTPFYVDTLFGLEDSVVTDPARPVWFLILDLHRAFLYHDPMTLPGPHLDSLRRFVIDDYPYQPFHSFLRYFSSKPLIFPYPLECLDVILLLWRKVKPGEVATMDFRTGEIRTAVLHTHPEARNDADTTLVSEPFVLRSRSASQGWREPGFAPLEDLLSADFGPLRNEHLVVPLTPLASAFVRVAWSQGSEQAMCGAHSFHPYLAKNVGRCEAVERFQVIFQPPGQALVHGSFDGLSKAIDPELLFFTQPLPDRANHLAAYSRTIPLYWTWADRVDKGTRHLVPAQEIWFNTRRLAGETFFIRPTTNGSALGHSLEEASLFALLELIERDAYMAMWYLRRRCAQILPESVSYEPFQMLLLAVRNLHPNYKIHLFHITADIHIPVVAVAAVRQYGDGPRTVHSAAANPSCELALFSALKDICAGLAAAGPQFDRKRALELLAHPSQIVNSEEHRLLYMLDEVFERTSFLDFGADPELTSLDVDRASLFHSCGHDDLGEMVRQIAAHMESLGLPVLLKNITHAAFAARGLFCVRAIVPGAFPIWYGHNYLRITMTDRLRKLAQTFSGHPLDSIIDLNLDVQPLG
ncbi:MAG TPA: YcaO-like family protein [Candidatus Angelobacter sp.]|nr:YcaO-like family protein [Candidatus Angelobacter sp.]